LLDYTAIEGLDAAEVWLSLSDDQVDQIIKEYQFMKNKNEVSEDGRQDESENQGAAQISRKA
jgi:hypothetical protein